MPRKRGSRCLRTPSVREGQRLIGPRTNWLHMRSVRVSGRLRRVANGLALRVPAREARRAGLAAGDAVDAIIRYRVSDPFGLLHGLSYRPFERRKEGQWRERI
jgi:hypothetical protein